MYTESPLNLYSEWIGKTVWIITNHRFVNSRGKLQSKNKKFAIYPAIVHAIIITDEFSFSGDEKDNLYPVFQCKIHTSTEDGYAFSPDSPFYPGVDCFDTEHEAQEKFREYAEEEFRVLHRYSKARSILVKRVMLRDYFPIFENSDEKGSGLH